MSAKGSKGFIWFLVIVMLVSVACRFGATEATPEPGASVTQDVPVATEAPVEVTEAVNGEAPTAEGAVTRLQDVRNATIQIVSQGTFEDPEFGTSEDQAGSGTGFIIDPSGIAITANHVVAGAALLQIWVGGDTSKTYNAKVLGMSECSDLAVLDIEGDGFPYLQWAEGPVEVGTDMYIAGFPLGDPEFTLNKGIISKAKANGVSAYSSVESAIEYDATSNPGNSGGPVVNSEGKVLGIHYSGNRDARQAFGISKDLALDILEDLKAGRNVDTIGLNGMTVSNEDGSLTGVWVSSVQSGSPADKAGIKGGDIITRMENVSLATDGTMKKYCEILRSHTPGDTLSVEVIRWNTGDVFEGQINGRELAMTGSLTQVENTNTEPTQEVTTVDTTNQPNPNATNPGELYFESEFDNMDNWTYFLMSGKEQNFSQEAVGGKFRVEIDARKTYTYFTYDAFEAADVRVDTTVENLGMNQSGVSLMCRYSDAGWYEFLINNDGTYNILYFDASIANKYVALYTGGSRLINMGKASNTFTAICKGNQLTLGINGVEVKTLTDSNLKSGTTGLGVGSEEVYPIIVEFDNFLLSVP